MIVSKLTETFECWKRKYDDGPEKKNAAFKSVCWFANTKIRYQKIPWVQLVHEICIYHENPGFKLNHPKNTHQKSKTQEIPKIK